MKETQFDFGSYEGFDERCELDTLEEGKKYILVDDNGTHIRLTATAYSLLSAVRSGISFKSLAAIINKRSERRVTAIQLEKSYEQLTAKLAKITEQTKAKRLPWGFWARIGILPEHVVHRIAPRLGFFYSPWLAGALCLLIAAAIVHCWQTSLRLEYSGSAFLYGYLIFLGSMLIHEFGHAAACDRFGAKPSEIGFAMYLIYPALYSDVTTAWRLSRWKRVGVDLGGCYFQLILGTLFVTAFEFTGWAPLRIAFLLIVYACVFSLNPIFRFDGYWVLADVLGVTNLARQPRRIATHAVGILRGKTVRPLPWPKPVLGILVLYSLASSILWSSFVWKLIPLLHGRLLKFLSECRGLAGHVAFSTRPHWAEIKAILVSIYVLAILGVMLWQLLKASYLFLVRTVPKLRRKLKSAEIEAATPTAGAMPAMQPARNEAFNSFSLISPANDGE